MSWTEKKLSLPFMASRGSHSHPHAAAAAEHGDRDHRHNLVQAASLRKLKTNKRKWFVLYSASSLKKPSTSAGVEARSEMPARLEYYDNERKWTSGSTPSRVVILEDCLNICRKHDSRDSKHKLVIALYTPEDCLGILFEEEEELRVWLDLLLSHQKGRSADGKIPRPTYEHMWQVMVKRFEPEDKLNTFTMSGLHRLCVTGEDLRFFGLGSGTPISFPVISLRQCMCNERTFQLETGRSAPSGAGTLIILCEDKDIAADLNSATIKAMDSSRNHSERLTAPKSGRHRRGEHQLSHDSGIGGIGGSAHRPRSESCSKVDPSGNSSTGKSSQSTMSPLDEPSIMASRNRTISEGNQFALHPRNPGKASIYSGSPLSPSPSSYISSESAGSSNSIDDAGSSYNQEGRHGHSTKAEGPSNPTIYEDSAESWVDPNANRELSESPPRKSGGFAPEERVVSHTRAASDSVQYTPVDISPRPRGATAASPPSTASPTASALGASARSAQPSATDYASFVNPASGTPAVSSLEDAADEYMTMTPTSAASSLRQQVTTREQERLALLGLSAEASSAASKLTAAAATSSVVTSPSSQSSYNPLEDLDPDSGYHVMSPQNSTLERHHTPPQRGIPISQRTFNHSGSPSSDASRSTRSVERTASTGDDEYMTMSPVSVATSKLSSSMLTDSPPQAQMKATMSKREGMDIPLRNDKPNAISAERDEYEVMSPVAVDVDRHHRDRGGNAEPTPLRVIEQQLDSEMAGHSSSSVAFDSSLCISGLPSGARPKQYAGRSSGSKRSSLCSDGGGFTDGRWSPSAVASDLGWEADPHNDLDAHPIYEAIDYSNRVTQNSSASAIPIPGHAGSRMSPASSSSVVSGTPNSVESRFPNASSQPYEFPAETKTRSYLRRDDDDELSGRAETTTARSPSASVSSSSSQLPSRAYSVSALGASALAARASPSSSVQSRSRTNSISNHLMEVPSRLSSAAANSSRLSPSQLLGRTPPVAHQPVLSHSPNLKTRIGDFFRGRTGSVPSKAAGAERRRHRTQSEGEKDSEDVGTEEAGTEEAGMGAEGAAAQMPLLRSAK